ncbi:MAG: hypothetical protein RL291_723 [Pseudomonadota bacterium]
MTGATGRGLKIAIVGAGTAGLAVATLLARQGHEVVIYERFASAAPVGAGIMIQPTGLACLAELGADQEAIALGRVMHGIDGLTQSGREVFNLDYAALTPKCFGLAMHRGGLFHVLSGAVARAGVTLTMEHDIVDAPEAGWQRRLVDARGGEHGPFDLVIDASGARSRLRRAHADVRLEKPYPYGALWATVPEPEGWPTPHRLTQRYRSAREMCGLLPLGTPPGFNRPQMAFFWSLPVGERERWKSESFEAWKGRVHDLWPEAARTIEHFTRHEDVAFATYSDMWLVRPDDRGIVFVGDAARSASPQLGQGANMALIDALLLARHLDSATQADLHARLDAYGRARRAHTRFYGFASWLLTPFFQSNSVLAGALRDVTFKPMARVPYVRREMVRTLTGMKTGLFTSFDPGVLNGAYTMRG